MNDTELWERIRRLPDLPDGFTTTWILMVDGRRIPVRRGWSAVLDVPGRPTIGLSYGLINDGKFTYDGNCFTEWGGGGVLTVPFTIIKGVLWVLVADQYRYLVGRPIAALPRGYKPAGVAFAEHARVELGEELGDFAENGKQFPLSPKPAYYATHIVDFRPVPGEPNPGGYQFGARLHPENFVIENARPLLKPGLFAPKDPLESIQEKPALRWHEAAQCEDSAVHTGVLRLMAWLRNHNIRFS